jgi:membrane protein required for beta-lactamase induction
LIGTVVLLAAGGAVVYAWSPWPAWSTLASGGTLGTLRLMQLAAQKLDLLFDVFTIGLCLLVILFGRRFGAGRRSHVQQILIGLSTASIAQMAVRGIWQSIAAHAVPHTQAEYEHVVGLQEKLYNGNSVVFIAVMVWWIVCLWINEPGSDGGTPVVVADAPVEVAEPMAETPRADSESV